MLQSMGRKESHTTEQQQQLVMLSIFSCVCGTSAYSLWKNVYSSVLPIFNVCFDVMLFLYFLYCHFISHIFPPIQ